MTSDDARYSQRSLQEDTRGQVGTGGFPVGLTILAAAAAAYPVYTAYRHWGEPLYATKTVMKPTTVSYGLLPEVFQAMAPALLLLIVGVVVWGISGGIPMRVRK